MSRAQALGAVLTVLIVASWVSNAEARRRPDRPHQGWGGHDWQYDWENRHDARRAGVIAGVVVGGIAGAAARGEADRRYNECLLKTVYDELRARDVARSAGVVAGLTTSGIVRD
jgi:hypothetical protein